MESIAETITEEEVVCLNCGTVCTGNFCPECGQSTSVPSKLKMKNFGKSVLMSFGRLTPGFFSTAKGLMLHPWTVIQDHIHGRHVRYSPPVTMVIQVFLYATILYAAIDACFGTKLMEAYDFNSGIFELEKKDNINPLLVMLDQSIVVQALFCAVPICFIIYIAYFRHGSRKYNFAEYMAAAVYMFAALTMYDVIFNLLVLIPGCNFETSMLTFVVLCVFSFIILIKAFPQSKWWKNAALFGWTIFLFLLAVLILSAIIGIIVVLNPGLISEASPAP